MPDLIDGFVTMLDGMHAGIEPQLLKESAYALGVNVSSRRGFVQTRPGSVKEADLVGTTFQGIGRWSLDDGEYLVYVADGNVRVYDLTTSADTLVAAGMTGQCYFCQVDRWMVVQDGVARPVVIEESGGVFTVSRNPGDTRAIYLISGTIGAYVHGRYHYVPTFVPYAADADHNLIPDLSATDGHTCFVSSDPRDTVEPWKVFEMTETVSASEGPALGLPYESGFITAMAPLRNAETGTGMGPLLVFGREGVSAFDVSIVNRQEWQTQAISQVLFSGASTRSPFSLQCVNGDLVFIDTEGHIRSVKYSTSEIKSALSCTPMSYELDPYVSVSGLATASLSHADNRILATFLHNGSYFRGLASLDLAPLYGLVGKPSPIYDGFWTGYEILYTIAARKSGLLTHFLVVNKSTSGLALVRLDPTLTTDAGQPIESSLVTRVMNGTNGDIKQLKYCELWLADVDKTTSFEVLYRPEGHPTWFTMGTKTINVPVTATHTHTRRRLRFSVDFDSALCDSVAKRKSCIGDGFQIWIKWLGYAKIERCRIVMEPQAEAPDSCGTDNADDLDYTTGEDFDMYSHEVTI